MIDRVVLLVRIAVRNLLASPINLLIGGLILLGTLIFVLLGGMLDSLNQAMQRSVVGSLAGHLQIYSAASKDELALFGQMGNFPDLPVELQHELARLVPVLLHEALELVVGGDQPAVDPRVLELVEPARRLQLHLVFVHQVRDQEPALALRHRRALDDAHAIEGLLELVEIGADVAEEDERGVGDDRRDPVLEELEVGVRVLLEVRPERVFLDPLERLDVARLDRLRADHVGHRLLDVAAEHLDDLPHGIKTTTLVKSLQGALGSKETGIDALLAELLNTTDENFDQRYQLFYDLVVPQVQLYRVKVGDMLTIKAFTKSGYIQNVNVKVYGTFAFTGLEKSPLAGATSLMDLMSFRELFGYLTSDKAEELKEIQRSTGAKTVSRENAEAELFGEGAEEVVAEATPGLIDPDAALAGTGRKLREEDLIRRVYTQQQLDEGVVLHAAVMLEDPRRIDETMERIRQASNDQNLGIQVVSWQQASGLLGQIITVFRALLFVAVGIIFIAAMLIMYLSVLMATLQRTQMFGTMRAIGAQKGMILSMVLIESLVLGLIFGGLGMVAGAGVLAAIASKGIAAPNDVMYFFFSGPRLIPTLSTWPLVVAIVIILVVTIGSTLLPAMMAMRVSPLRAMQADE